MKRDRAAGASRTDWTVIGSSGADRVREQSRTYTTGRKGKRKVSVANGILVFDERVADKNPELEHLNYDEGERPLRPSVTRYYGTGATLLARESALGLEVPESVKLAGAQEVSGPDTTPIHGVIERHGPVRRVNYSRTQDEHDPVTGVVRNPERFRGGLRYAAPKSRPAGLYRMTKDGADVIAYVSVPERVYVPEDQHRTYKSRPDRRDRIAREVVQASTANDRRAVKLAQEHERDMKRIVRSIWR